MPGSMTATSAIRALVVVSGRQQGGPVRFLARWLAHSTRLHPRLVALGDGPAVAHLAAAGWPAAVWPEARVRELDRLLPLAVRLAGAARATDLVFGNGAREHVLGGLAAALARRPALWCCHNPWQAGLPLNQIARRVPAAAIVVASRSAAALLDPDLRRRARHVPFGVDLPARLEALDARAAAWRARLPAHDALLVVLGTLAPEKGQHVALAAAARLLPSRPGTLLVFVGPPGRPGYAPALRAQAAERGLAGRVLWPGPVGDPLVALRAADVVLHSSLAPETFGFAVAEAAAVGRAVVAAATGGPAEIVVHGQTGLLVPPGDAAALAAAVALLLDQPALRCRLGQAARARAQRCYDARRMAAALDALAGEVVAGRS